MHQAPVEDGVELKEEEEEAVHFRRSGFLVKCTALMAVGIIGMAASNAPGEEAVELVEQGTEILHALQEANEREEMYDLTEGCAEHP